MVRQGPPWEVKIAGIKLLARGNASGPGPAVATEDWTLTLDDSTFRWAVSREFLQAGVVNSDRTPALVLQPSFLPVPTTGADSCGGDGPADLCTETQMPSFVDETMQLDAAHDSGFALPARVGGPSSGNSPARPAAVFVEASSKRRRQLVELVPSGLALTITTANPRSTFSFGKAGIVGTPISFGGSLVDRAAPSANVTVSVGDSQSNELVIEVGRAVGTAPLSLSIPASPALPEIAANFARTHNVLFGSVFGNSPQSVTALQEMSVLPMIQSAFIRRPETAIDTTLAAQMRWYSAHINASGYLYSRWDVMDDEQNPIGTAKDSSSLFGCILDQIPRYILAHYYQVPVRIATCPQTDRLTG
eukprot:SAG22_NODE_341_length_11992_cov_180.308753_2_plen_361_part_00